jgi:glucose-1-phosphate thymidylyltransferase
MNVLILAAGYATRLYPLTLNKAKPLLEVAGKPMMEWVIDNLAPIPEIESVYVVTNQKFAGDFERWAEGYREGQPRLRFEVIDDGSTGDSDKLGAIGDLDLVIRTAGLDCSDLIVVAGDNLFSESLAGFGLACASAKCPVLGVYDVGSIEQAKKYGVVEIGEGGTLRGFEEKPSEPKSSKIGIALYFYPKAVVGMVNQYLAEGNNPDQPGRFVQWLYPRVPVHTWEVPGVWFDVGSKETLEEANRLFTAFREDGTASSKEF